MTMQEGLRGLRAGTVGRQLRDKAYFLDLLGDSHHGLGHPEAAIEAYWQAAAGIPGAGSTVLLRLVPVQDSGQLSVPE